VRRDGRAFPGRSTTACWRRHRRQRAIRTETALASPPSRATAEVATVGWG
jgi:hypothetical protein